MTTRKLRGLPPEGLLDHWDNAKNIIHPDFVAKIEDAVSRAFKFKSVEVVEAKIREGTRHYVDILIAVRVVRCKDCKNDCAVAIFSYCVLGEH